jgi:hypothetical protein
LDGTAVQVLLDSVPVAPSGVVTASSIVVQVPQTVGVGAHQLRVQRDVDVSAPETLLVDDFSVTGRYATQATVISTECLLVGGPVVGSTRALTLVLNDERPALQVKIGSRTLNGTVDARGAITAFPGFEDPPGPRTLSGRVTHLGDSWTIDAQLTTVVDFLCGFVEHVHGTAAVELSNREQSWAHSESCPPMIKCCERQKLEPAAGDK